MNILTHSVVQQQQGVATGLSVSLESPYSIVSLQSVKMCFLTFGFTALKYCTMQYKTVLILHCTIHYSTVHYSTVLYLCH